MPLRSYAILFFPLAVAVASYSDSTTCSNAGDHTSLLQLKNLGEQELLADKITVVHLDDHHAANFTVALLDGASDRTADESANATVALLDGKDGWGGNCDSQRGGFKCPAGGGCSSGSCREDGPGSWQEWLDAHNIRRCMHDVPAVTWSNAVYDKVKSTFQNQRQMSHSNSYGNAPPAGPAGENLAWGSYTLSPEQSTKMWYDEVNNCGSFPGCKTGSRGVTGHFTALIWDGVEEIGCHSNQHKLVACQYKGADQKGCTTPNMGGSYETNVFSAVKSRSQCEKIIEDCKDGKGNSVVPDDGDGEIDEDLSRPTPNPTPSSGGDGTCAYKDQSVTFSDSTGAQRNCPQMKAHVPNFCSTGYASYCQASCLCDGSGSGGSSGGGGSTCSKTDQNVQFNTEKGKMDCPSISKEVSGFCSGGYASYCPKSCACAGGDTSCCPSQPTPPPTPPPTSPPAKGKVTIMELKGEGVQCKGKIGKRGNKWLFEAGATVEGCQRACLADSQCKYASLRMKGKPATWTCASFKKCKKTKKNNKYISFQKSKVKASEAQEGDIWTES